MNKAEEFFKWSWSTLWNSTKHHEDIVRMMEAYHQSRVNAISEDKIVKDTTKHLQKSDYKNTALAYSTFGFRAVIKQLLKQ